LNSDRGLSAARSTGGDSITVTGCLYDAGADNKFTITGQDGKMYLLKSSKVALKDHVHHEVAVTGSIKEEDDEDENPEYREGDVKLLIVSSLKMISTKCR